LCFWCFGKNENTKGDNGMKAPTRPIPGSIATKGKGASASHKPTRRARPPLPVKMKDAESAPGFLNFRVPAEFKREFKTYAASHDMKMNELLSRSFQAYREQRGE
jgi:hypothetical protein